MSRWWPTSSIRRGRDGLIARAEEQAGPVDVLVNNAGIDATGGFTDLSADALARLVALNVLTQMELSRQVLPGMVARGRGHLLMISPASRCCRA